MDDIAHQIGILCLIYWLTLKQWALRAAAAVWNPFWLRIMVPVIWSVRPFRVFYIGKVLNDRDRLLRQSVEEIRLDRLRNPSKYLGKD